MDNPVRSAFNALFSFYIMFLILSPLLLDAGLAVMLTAVIGLASGGILFWAYSREPWTALVISAVISSCTLGVVFAVNQLIIDMAVLLAAAFQPQSFGVYIAPLLTMRVPTLPPSTMFGISMFCLNMPVLLFSWNLKDRKLHYLFLYILPYVVYVACIYLSIWLEMKYFGPMH